LDLGRGIPAIRNSKLLLAYVFFDSPFFNNKYPWEGMITSEDGFRITSTNIKQIELKTKSWYIECDKMKKMPSLTPTQT
jgi:hypothetical protein